MTGWEVHVTRVDIVGDGYFSRQAEAGDGNGMDIGSPVDRPPHGEAQLPSLHPPRLRAAMSSELFVSEVWVCGDGTFRKRYLPMPTPIGGSVTFISGVQYHCRRYHTDATMRWTERPPNAVVDR